VRDVANPANGARCLLLTGTGRAFCSGANLADDAPKPVGSLPGDELRTSYHPMLLAMRDLEMPMVSAVNGAAAGVGMSLAIMADMVCASRGAYFLQAFGRIGLVPDGGEAALLAGAMDIARQLASGPRSLALMRRAYWESTNNSYEQQLDMEARLQRQAGQSEDFGEGVAAFLAKRPATFSDR